MHSDSERQNRISTVFRDRGRKNNPQQPTSEPKGRLTNPENQPVNSARFSLTPMNIAQDNKIKMYLAVEAVCDKKQSVWQGLVAFLKAYQDFKNRVANIQSLNKQQERRKVGVTEDKRQLRVEMCDLAYPVCAALKAFAVETKNRELEGRVGFSRSDLLIGRDTMGADRCREILAAATENVAKLADYGVTPAKLAALQTAVDAFSAAITKPRETRVTGKTVTEVLTAEFKTVDEILRDRLDNLVPQLAGVDPTFVTDYRNARVIVAAAATHATGEKPAKPAPTAADQAAASK